jgi:uncharacterized membrane protein
MKVNPFTAAAVTIGIGMGGFVDGFLLHMILRWHHMLSNIIPPTTMEGIHANMLWDGLFHAFTWLVTLTGVFMLWSAMRRYVARNARMPTTKSFVGALVFGWGLFNLIEGVIDHHLLGFHNVREVPNPMPWNVGFLVIGGGLFLAAGRALMRKRGERRFVIGERRLT